MDILKGQTSEYRSFIESRGTLQYESNLRVCFHKTDPFLYDYSFARMTRQRP